MPEVDCEVVVVRECPRGPTVESGMALCAWATAPRNLGLLGCLLVAVFELVEHLQLESAGLVCLAGARAAAAAAVVAEGVAALAVKAVIVSVEPG